jgi:threonine dehydrogenase-like Zn-dependent dehydrogenase
MRVEKVPDPKIENTQDIILRVTKTAICGSDLHIFGGLFPQPKPLIMGNEFMGIVEETGGEVTALSKGDRVLIPFAVACVACFFAAMVCRGGVVSVVGVYGMPYDKFPLGQIFDKGISLYFGQAPVQKHIDDLILLVAERKIKPKDIITHRLPIEAAAHANDIFKYKKDNCVKVVLQP